MSASSGDDRWNETGTVWEFSVKPTFYQTKWFYASWIVTASLLIWTGWGVRMRRIRRQFSLVLADRARMSRELHDTLLQSLVGMALQLDNLASELDPSHESLKGELTRIRGQIDRYIGEAHQSILDLRSPTLQDENLSARIRETAERILDHKRIRLNFVVSGSGPQPVWRVQQELVRIAHEAVSNAVRHADPSSIEVAVVLDPESFRLRVTDDGCGFEPEVTGQKGPHWGLSIMRERADQIGATLTIRSSAGRGTRVDVLAPVTSKAYAETNP